MIKVLGSFTGIRIGVATVKAFADSKDIPCIGISSLQALAYNVKLIPEFGLNYTGLVCSILDCKNSNCYFGLYKFENGACTTIIEPSADTVLNALHNLSSICEIDKAFEINELDKTSTNNSNILFIGDGALVHNDIIKQTFPNCSFVKENSNILNSYSLALAGFDAYSSSSSPDILPLYLRKPQAQRQLESKLGLTMDINSKKVIQNDTVSKGKISDNGED